MKLTTYTDYSLRVLIYIATLKEDRLVNIKEIADAYQISKNHLMKVIYELGKAGYLETIRGRNGGIRLAQNPQEIVIGKVVQHTEDDFYRVECFDSTKNKCVLTSACKLKDVLNHAVDGYFDVLNQYTLADIIENKEEIQTLLK